MHAFKDIEFVMNLSCADHVPDLHEHEEVEDPGSVTGGFTICLFVPLRVERISIPVFRSSWINTACAFPVPKLELLFWLDDHVFASEKEDEDHNAHVNCHENNVLEHFS